MSITPAKRNRRPAVSTVALIVGVIGTALTVSAALIGLAHLPRSIAPLFGRTGVLTFVMFCVGLVGIVTFRVARLVERRRGERPSAKSSPE